MLSKRKADSQGGRGVGFNGLSTEDSMQQSPAVQPLQNRPIAKAVRRRVILARREAQGHHPPSRPQPQMPLPVFNMTDASTTVSNTQMDLVPKESPGPDGKAPAEMLFGNLPKGPVITNPFSVTSASKEPEPNPFSTLFGHPGNYQNYGGIASGSPSNTIVNDLKAAPTVGQQAFNPPSSTVSDPTSLTYSQALPTSYVSTSSTMYNLAMSGPNSPAYIQTLPATYVPTSPAIYNPTMPRPTSPTTYSQTLPATYVSTVNPTSSAVYSGTSPTKHYPPSLDSSLPQSQAMPKANEVAGPLLFPTAPIFSAGMTAIGESANNYESVPAASAAPAEETIHYPNLAQQPNDSLREAAGPEQLPYGAPQIDALNTVRPGRDASNAGPVPDIFVDRQPQSQNVSPDTSHVDGFEGPQSARMELQSANAGALNGGSTMPLGEIPLPNSETETLARNSVYSKCPGEAAPQIDPITKVQSTNLFSFQGPDNTSVTKNQDTRIPLSTQSLSGAGSGGVESAKPQPPRKIAHPGKSFTMSPASIRQAIIPEPPKATNISKETMALMDAFRKHFDLDSVLKDVPNIPADFSESQRDLYMMQYRIRALNIAFKEATSMLNLSTAADWEPWSQLRDDICEQILEAGGRSLKRKRTGNEAEESQSRKRANILGGQRNPHEASGNNVHSDDDQAPTGRAISTPTPAPTELAKGISQTASVFSNILNQRPILEAKRDSEKNTPKPSAPVEPTGTVSTSLQSNATTPSISTTPIIQPPKFGTPGNFMSQFAKIAEETTKKDKAKRKAEDFDSEEEDEEEWERRDTEAQLLKRKKIEEESENRRTTFVPGKGFSLTPTPAKPTGIFGTLTPPVSASKGGLFDRISVGKDGKPMRVLPTDTEQSAKTPPASNSGIFGTESNCTNGTNAFGFKINPPSDAEKSTKSASAGSTPTPSGESSAVNSTNGLNAFGFKINPPSDGEGSAKSPSAGSTPIHSGESSAANSTNGLNAFGFKINPPSDAEKSTKSSSAGSTPIPSGESNGINAFGFKINPPSGGEALTRSSSASSTIIPSSESNSTNVFKFSINPTSQGESSTSRVPTNPFAFNINPPSDGEKPTKSPSTGQTPTFGEKTATNAFVFNFNSPSDGEKRSASRAPIFGEKSSTNTFGFNFNPPSDGDQPAKSPSESGVPIFSEKSATNAFGFNFNPTSDREKSAKSPSTGSIFGSDVPTDPVVTASSVFQSGGLFSAKPTPKSIMSLSAPAMVASSNTSRATTPGATTDAGDSASESTAEGHTPNGEDDLGYTFAGESDEDVIFQVKARAYEFVRKTGQYEKHGAGRFRVLKHKTTGKTRMVHRTAPQWSVFLNAALLPAVKYETTKDNAVRIITASEDGSLTQWKMKVLRKEDATELARVLNENAPPVEPARVPEENGSSAEPTKPSKEEEAVAV